MNKRMVSMTLLTVATAGLINLGTARRAPATSGCSNATLHGSYGLRATGNVLSGPAAGPVANVGVVHYDGIGQLTASLTQRVNGAAGPTTVSTQFIGTYSVNPDCTVEDVWQNVANGGTSTHLSAITDHGRGFFLIATSGSGVVTAEARKVFAGDVEHRD
jgi:hypothetical protein